MLNSHGVDYVVVGAIAVSYHAYPRNTGDLDVLVRSTPENAERLLAVLKAFGFRPLGLKPAELIQPGKFVQLGIRPRRIDLLHEISGVEFSEVWEGRVVADVEGLPVSLIGRDALIKNKKAAGREKDLADLRVLEAGPEREG